MVVYCVNNKSQESLGGATETTAPDPAIEAYIKE
jgi:hypothetical protein